MKPQICSIVLLVCLSPAAFADLYWCPVCGGNTHHSDGHPHFRRGGGGGGGGRVYRGPTARQLAVRAYNLSIPYFKSRDWPQAIKHLRKSLAHDSSYSSAKYWLQKALEYQLRDRLAAAAERACREREANGQAAKQRGLAAADRGDWSQAIRELERARYYLPDDRDIENRLEALRLKQTESDNFNTGMIYFNSGDWERAVTYLREANRYNRDNPEYVRRLKEAEAKLAQSLARGLDNDLRTVGDDAFSFEDLGGKDDADLSFKDLGRKDDADFSFEELVDKDSDATAGRPGADPAPTEKIPVPVIVPKDYIQIDATKWPEELKPKIELTNAMLAQMQDQVESASKSTVNWVEIKLRETVSGRLPGYAVYRSVRNDLDDMIELFGKDRTDYCNTNMDFFRRAAADSMLGGNRASDGEEIQTIAERKAKYDRQIGERIKSDVESRWSEAEGGSDEPRRVVPIEDAPLHPDAGRTPLRRR